MSLTRRELLRSVLPAEAPPAIPVARVEIAAGGKGHPPPWQLGAVPGDPTRYAALDRSRCLAWQGGVCSTCSEVCSRPGAIVIRSGRPSVDPRACDGCGVCLERCPAPEPALSAAPRGLRLAR